MKKGLLFASVLAALLCAGCQNGVYYQSASSEETSYTSYTDSVPPYVFGENGFYDTVNDVEFYRCEGVYAGTVGEVYGSCDGRTVYTVEGVHESYLLCDEDGVIYKNADLPWTVEPGEEGFAEAYPALRSEIQDAVD